MTDPVRLLDATSSPALAAVLRSAAEDVPTDPEGGRRRIYAAASLATGAGLATSLWMRRATWLLLGSAVALVGAGAWWAGGDDGSPVRARSPRTVEAARVTKADDATPMASIRVDDLPTATATPAAVTPLRVAPPEEVPLPDELTMIDAVRSSLAAGQPSEALDRLTAYRRVYPHGALDVEADVLEVQALSGIGRTDAAQAKAHQFLETHPGSPYEKRIRAETKL